MLFLSASVCTIATRCTVSCTEYVFAFREMLSMPAKESEVSAFVLGKCAENVNPFGMTIKLNEIYFLTTKY